MAVPGAQGRQSAPLVHRGNVEKRATVVPSATTLWSVSRGRYNKTQSGGKSPQSLSPLSLSQSVDNAARTSKAPASSSKPFNAGAPPHSSQVHSSADVPSGSSTPRDSRATGAILESSSKSPSSRVWPSVDQTQRLSPLSPGGSPTLRISCISGAATHPSKGSPLRRNPPQGANGPPIGESRSALHLPLDSPKQSNGPGGNIVEWRSRRTSSPRRGSPQASPPKQLAPLANSESLTAGPCTPKHAKSSGQHPSSPSVPTSVSSHLSQGAPSGMASLATPPQIATTGSKVEHTSVARSYASETERSGHQHSSFAPPDGDESPELGTHQKSVALNATRSSAPGRQDDTTTEVKIEASETQKKLSPLNTVVFVCCLVPASLLSIVLFLVFMYHFYLRDVDVAPTPELRIAIHEISKERWQHGDRLSMREVMVIVLLVAIGMSHVIETDRHIGIDSTTVSSLCVLMAVGIPPTLGNPLLTEHVLTWQLVLRRLPWQLILVRLGGSALQVIAEHSGVSTWLMETLLGHVNTRVHPAWCLVGLMAATALVCEVDTGVAGFPLVHKLILLSERIQMHPLYFVLPVLMQSRCVLLMPYTSTPLAFLHLYTHMRSAELYWLGLLLKVIFCVPFVVAANTMLFV
ncbi:uncharacterized protein LOC119444905 isoform X2 [Dermacentor silvarum]|uniref:uncharacterized protein LOC119444905 isoform X2 n=1 Tax=Dermacentor silvarum TaxID=543639 RepID=UPI0021017615|nr:uncharacterized protein LOC119444905 isoform X2 [Dermacentor silvarum]